MANYAFIINDFEYSGGLPLKIFDGYFLDKPSDKQLEKIRDLTTEFGSKKYTNVLHEANRKMLDSGGVQFIPDISSDKWRYWVINISEEKLNISNLKYALNIAWHKDISIGFIFKGDENGWEENVSSQLLFNHYGSNTRSVKGIETISKETLQSVKSYYDKLESLKSDFEQIYRAHADYEELKITPSYSRFSTIGFFTVIESIITHKPNPTDPGDSLRKQISTKINLLNKRYEKPLDHNEYFQKANFKTIWSKLYDLRSNIVHGNMYDFNSNLTVLKNIKSVNTFLKETTRSLLKLSTKEAQLIQDLKDC